MNKYVLFLDDMEERHVLFRKWFISEGYNEEFSCLYCYDYSSAVEKLKSHEVKAMFLDHDLSLDSILCNPNDCKEKTGSDLAEWLVTNKNNENAIVILHSLNPVGVKNMMNILSDDGRTVVQCSFLDLINNKFKPSYKAQ